MTSPESADVATADLRKSDLVVALVIWAVLRELQVSFAGGGFGNDLNEYFAYAKSWASGRTPYVDFFVEYPPGALILFLLPFLMGGREHFIKAFVGQMVALDCATFVLVLLLARELFPANLGRQRLAAGSYLLATALLQPVLYARFDLAPALLVLGATYLTLRHRRLASPFLLGLGGAVKLWPLLLLPMWLGQAYRKGGSQGVVRVGAMTAVGYAAPMLLLLPRAGGKVTAFFHFHVARGLQLESTWASVLLMLGRLGIIDVSPVSAMGAWEVQGAGCSVLAQASVVAVLMLSLAPQYLSYRHGLDFDSKAAKPVVVWAVAAVVLGFLVGGKVLSPQYLVWIAALMALSGAAASGMLVGASAFTTLIYPLLYPALSDSNALGHGSAVWALLLRNVLLCAAYVLLLRKIVQAPGLTSPIPPGH